jgi:hypothetical protein
MATTNGIPSKPQKPTDWSDQAKVQEYMDAKADYNFALQSMAQDRSEESATRSNISKAEHDAMMIIAQNMKA